MVRRLLSVLVLSTALAACATADPPTVKDGCAVNFKKVCQSVVNQALDNGSLTANGETLDRQRLQNLSVRHIEVEVPFLHGSGALLRCEIDTQTTRISDGSMSADGPALSDVDIEHLRQSNLCS